MVDREPAKTFEDLIAWQKAHARSRADKARILNVAEASLEEARYHLRLAIDLGYMAPNDLPARALEVARVLGAYTATIASRPA